MPTSLVEHVPTIVRWASAIELEAKRRPFRILDVGPGFGKYGALLREYLPPGVVIDAVEAEPSYVTDRLRALYDRVFENDVRGFTDAELARYDLVLIVDVIEHMPSEDGKALLARIPGRAIVSTPMTFFENPADLPASERHVSLWSWADFEETGRVEANGTQHAGYLVLLGPYRRTSKGG